MVLSEIKPATHSAIRNSANAVLLYDDRGRVIQVNDSAAKMLGYDPAELTRKSILELHPVEYMLESMRAFREIGATGFARLNLLFRKKDGKMLCGDTTIMVKKFNGRSAIEATIRELPLA